MTDHALAAGWDADHRLAALASFIAGIVLAVGTGLVFSVGEGPISTLVAGGKVGSLQVSMVAGLLLAVDLALLVFVVGLAHAFTEGRSFGLTVTTAVATLATTASATLHLVWAHVASSPEVALSAEVTHFVTWLAANIWLLPLYGMLVGATLLALALALRQSAFRFARGLGIASAALGGVLCLLAPFSAMGDESLVMVTVVAITLASGGVSVLVAVALVRVGLLLVRTRHAGQADTQRKAAGLTGHGASRR